MRFLLVTIAIIVTVGQKDTLRADFFSDIFLLEIVMRCTPINRLHSRIEIPNRFRVYIDGVILACLFHVRINEQQLLINRLINY